MNDTLRHMQVLAGHGLSGEAGLNLSPQGAQRGGGTALNREPILVVDDNPQIRRAVRTILVAQGFVVMDARNAEEALDLIRKERVELILLDVNLPGMSGLEACREIRRTSHVPIIMLTVRDREQDKVQAFDAGADDYMVKPFGSDELMARVRATLRRTESERPAQFSAPGLHIDFERRTVSASGRVARLTPKEFELLRQLVTNEGRTLTHRWLLQTVWGPDYGNEMESLRVLINQLRKKIEADSRKPRFLLTEPWVGYRFETPKAK
jgi:two-component system, OmpR family, KDP operon response regulator KdpE